MNKKIISSVLVIIILIVIIIAVNSLFGLRLFKSGEKVNQPEEQKNQEEVIENQNTSEQEENKTEQENENQSEEEKDYTEIKSKIKLKARNFIEKYGTYSAYNKKENYSELESLVTQSFFSKLSNEAKKTEEGLEGIQTTVGSVEIKNFNPQGETICGAEVREIIEKDKEDKTSYSDVEIVLKNTSSGWKVDEIK